jgi:hypothetical protein
LLATVYTKTIAILWGKSTMAREENHDENDSLSLLGKCRIFTSWSLLITLTGVLLVGIVW